MMQQPVMYWVCTLEKAPPAYLSKTQRANALSNPTLLQLTVHVIEISVVEDEALDVGDELPHQGLHRGGRPVALGLRFGGHALGEPLHPADLQE